MREHLYRGKQTETGKWEYGSLIIREEESPVPETTEAYKRYYIANGGFDIHGYEVIPETIGQFIGLMDKVKAKIFDGDIFTVMGRCPKLVKFIDKIAAFCIANIDQLKDEKWVNIWGVINEVWWNDFRHDIEVIGNIHDNPELLGAQNDKN